MHHILRNGQVVALGADGVALAVDLLHQEVQLPAHGDIAGQHGPQLGHVAVQAHRLLVHCHLVGKNGRLGEDAGLVDGSGLQYLHHLGLQPLAVGRHRLR